MIRYTTGNTLTILYWWGGINRVILPKAFVYFLLVSAIYSARVFGSSNLDFYTQSQPFHDTLKGILSFLVFLLVFRLNQSMNRHYAVISLVTDLFHGLERLTVDFCTQVRGDNGESCGLVSKPSRAGSHHEPHHGVVEPSLPPGARSGLARAAKVNVIRLILAYAVSLLLHFQILDAASDANGKLDGIGIDQIIFLYCRLRCLLYDEEMHLLDNALSVLKTNEKGEVSFFRTEANRYRLRGDSSFQQVIGYREEDRCEGGVTVAPAPKIIMNILLRAMQKPADEPWGYEARLWNIYWRDTLNIAKDSMNLESIIMSPTPLAYLQHCRMLFLIFAVTFPASMDASKGFLYNVALPLLVFWSIMGFDVLAAMLENPLGNGEADMNLHEKVHSLEVNAEIAFDAGEVHQSRLFFALERTENLILGEAQAEEYRNREPLKAVNYVDTFCGDTSTCFRTYFHWVPIPTVILGDMLDSHGEVENLHQLRLHWRHLFCGLNIRKMLRESLKRPKASDNDYVQVECDEPTVKHPVDFNKDANYFCHYIEFVGADMHADGTNRPLDQNWIERAAALLSDQQAGRLLDQVDDEDSARSVMVQGKNVSRFEKAKGIWERLS